MLLFNVVAGWNNFFLPLIMLNDPQWYPLTLGLEQWSGQANIQGAAPIFDLVITGSLLGDPAAHRRVLAVAAVLAIRTNSRWGQGVAGHISNFSSQYPFRTITQAKDVTQ